MDLDGIPVSRDKVQSFDACGLVESCIDQSVIRDYGRPRSPKSLLRQRLDPNGISRLASQGTAECHDWSRPGSLRRRLGLASGKCPTEDLAFAFSEVFPTALAIVYCAPAACRRQSSKVVLARECTFGAQGNPPHSSACSAVAVGFMEPSQAFQRTSPPRRHARFAVPASCPGRKAAGPEVRGVSDRGGAVTMQNSPCFLPRLPQAAARSLAGGAGPPSF